MLFYGNLSMGMDGVALVLAILSQTHAIVGKGLMLSEKNLRRHEGANDAISSQASDTFLSSHLLFCSVAKTKT